MWGGSSITSQLPDLTTSSVRVWEHYRDAKPLCLSFPTQTLGSCSSHRDPVSREETLPQSQGMVWGGKAL